MLFRIIKIILDFLILYLQNIVVSGRIIVLWVYIMGVDLIYFKEVRSWLNVLFVIKLFISETMWVILIEEATKCGKPISNMWKLRLTILLLRKCTFVLLASDPEKLKELNRWNLYRRCPCMIRFDLVRTSSFIFSSFIFVGNESSSSTYLNRQKRTANRTTLKKCASHTLATL